jgi:radical SAM protein with 4Fe4S-binding SPASM domain
MGCASVGDISYGEFSRRLHGRVAGQRIPITGSIEVTERCNLKCAHCYINRPVNDTDALKGELGRQELEAFIDQIVDEGCLWLLLTGGEPFVRPDFSDIYEYAKKKGLLITLFTNGTAVTPRIADHLSEWRPFFIEITLYGRTRETYERVTGVPGSYERCIRGIELLLERKLPLKLKSAIMTLNLHEVWDMKSYAESLGVDFRFDPVLNMRVDGGKQPGRLRISPDEAALLDVADQERIKEWRVFSEKFSGPPQRPEYLYQCGAGVNSFHVDSSGHLSSCIMARTPAYDLRKGSFSGAWQDFLPQVLAQKWSQEAACKGCSLIAMCGQCPGWAQLETGDQEKPVEYLCRLAHLRANAFAMNQ